MKHKRLKQTTAPAENFSVMISMRNGTPTLTFIEGQAQLGTLAGVLGALRDKIIMQIGERLANERSASAQKGA